MAAAGDEAVVWANEGVAINVANRIVINAVAIFMARILPVPDDKWQVRKKSKPSLKRLSNQGTRIKVGPNLSYLTVANAKELTKRHYGSFRRLEIG